MVAARWLKGNTHTHTSASDGDASLEDVARWYESHGYDFLVITDHNRVTAVDAWNGGGHPLLLLPGCEISLSSEGRPVHVNSLGSATLPDLASGTSISATLQCAVDAARAAGGVPQINHPNYKWAFGDQELSRVTGYRLLEVHNGSADTNNFAGGGSPGVEEMWDRVLTSGHRVWMVAADDAHHFRNEPRDDPSPPGRAWVMVQSETRTGPAILAALERGDFYATTEVTLDRVDAGRDAIALAIASHRDYRYSTRFIGRGGRVLAAAHGPAPVYRPRGDEGYVRAKVRSSNGGTAWTQPVFL